MELNAVPAVKLFELDRRLAAAGKTRSSPASGAVPPQLAELVQKLSPGAPPVQVRTTAGAKGAVERSSAAANGAEQQVDSLIGLLEQGDFRVSRFAGFRFRERSEEKCVEPDWEVSEMFPKYHCPRVSRHQSTERPAYLQGFCVFGTPPYIAFCRQEGDKNVGKVSAGT